MPPMKRLPTVMGSQHNFSQVPRVNIERSVFDRSHGYKTTFDAGLLVPFLVDWILPGDTFTCKVTGFARLTTPIKPLMDNMYWDFFFFFVPDRLVWANFPKFMGEQVNPGDSISYTIPQMLSPAAGYAIGSIADYMGLPTTGTPAVTAQYTHSALPNRAYHLVFNQWFRDENLVPSVDSVGGSGGVTTGDGPDSNAAFNNNPRKRGKRHDYFTSCLPFLQKGTAVGITPSGAIPIRMAGVTGESAAVLNAAGTQRNLEVSAAVPKDVTMKATGGGITLTADLAGLTVNDLRQSFQVQKFLERDARGGTRYTEIVRSHFGVISPDARLQRAEYLGGGSVPVVIAPVAQTTVPVTPTNQNALANLGAVGSAVASRVGFTKSFTEHGTLLGIMNVRADLTYSQGIERGWSHLTRFDRYWPEFSHIGEQAVLNKELFCTGAAADANVFGYQERYAEYRYKPSKVTGLFRPSASGTLAIWHLSELFSALPTLGTTFIEDQTSSILGGTLPRVLVTSEPDFYCDMWIGLQCARPMPVFGVPGFIDHF